MTEEIAIRCMQLPLLNLQLLLPNSAVAEIIGYMSPEEEYVGTDWFDGLIAWRGVMVPVVSVEQMCQMEAIEPGPRSRIAILYNPKGDDSLPYVGLILKDIPRAYLAEDDRLMEAVDSLDCDYLLSHVDAMIDELMIPDLDAIVEAVRQRTNQ